MTTTHSAIAIGGPADGLTLISQSLFLNIPTGDGGKFTYGWHSCAGVNYWTSSDMPLSAIMAKLIERYGQFRDFASGKTLEVINALADKVQELEARDAGKEAKIQALEEGSRLIQKARDKATEESQRLAIEIGPLAAERDNAIEQWKNTQILLDGREMAIRAANEENNALIHEAREIRRLCSAAGIEGQAMTTEWCVSQVVACLGNNRRSLDECKTRHNETIDSIRAELKSTGHKHEGRPLSDLVDKAIDTERERHTQTILKIADACGISFAIGHNYLQMADIIVNSLRNRQEKKLVAMQAEPAGDMYATTKLSLEARVDNLETRVKEIGAAGARIEDFLNLKLGDFSPAKR